MGSATCETMDWDAEAKRVAAAFGIEGECRFVAKGSGMELEIVDDAKYTSEIRDDEGKYIGVLYNDYWRIFSVCFGEYESGNHLATWRDMYAQISINWDEELIELSPHSGRHYEFLAMALFRLGFSPEKIESALKVTITAHQKLEWTLEYEGRMGVQSAT